VNDMTPEQAHYYNLAITHALREYPKGRGAIQGLQKRIEVTVEHVGRSTVQDWKVVDTPD